MIIGCVYKFTFNLFKLQQKMKCGAEKQFWYFVLVMFLFHLLSRFHVNMSCQADKKKIPKFYFLLHVSFSDKA